MDSDEHGVAIMTKESTILITIPKIIGSILLLAALCGTCMAATGSWSTNGPPASGAGNQVISALAVNGNTIYAGTGNGFVYSFTPSAAPVPPVAGFTSNITAGTVPLAVQFDDTSDAFEPLMWNWSLGNNYWFNTTDISQRNASYTYHNAGTYDVSLTVTNASGSTTATEAGYIHVTAPGQPTASFSGVPTTGTAPLMVTFTDSSQVTGGEMWNWSFGDNSWSNTTVSSSPVHTYSSVGTYTVSLIVTNTTGSDTRTRPGYVIVNAAGTLATTTTMPVQQSHGGSRSDYWANSGNTGTTGYTGPAPAPGGSSNPAPQQPAKGSQPPGSPGSSSSAPPPVASSGTSPSSGGIPVVSVIEGVAGIGVFTGGGFIVRRWWIQRQNPALFRKYK
jgi:PKD repeat protein